MVKAACLLAAALALISSGATYSRNQARPTTLVSAKGPIAAFAQDGNQLAWASIDTHAACPWQVRIRLLGSGKQRVVDKPGGPTCRSDSGFDLSQETSLALAGKRALWTLQESGNYSYTQLVTASYTAARDVQLEKLESSNDYGDGDHLGGIAGDSSTLVYGVAEVYVDTNACIDTGEDCTAAISGGSVERVTGADTVSVPDAPPPLMLAASGNRVALVVAETASTWGSIGPGSAATVTVKNAVSGANVGSFSPSGKPLALALSPSVVAVLESTAGGRQIEFRTPSGVLLRSVVVPANATALSTTNRRAVFRVGRTIQTIPVAAGSVKKVVTAAATPIGLSIEGTRVAWAENVKIRHVLRGRIRAITVR